MSLCLLPQIFVGNQNHDTPELRSVGPLLTRFVRIYPERATNEGLGLRLELLGCELDGEFHLQIVCIDFNSNRVLNSQFYKSCHLLRPHNHITPGGIA